jgi:hypothetical protein
MQCYGNDELAAFEFVKVLSTFAKVLIAGISQAISE